jgi:2,4-dienoyl-CoA reductase (NADPH2)
VGYVALEPGGIRIVDETGTPELLAADTVVLAAGQEPEDALLAPLRRLGLAHVVIGGARHAEELDAVRAFREGLEAAHALAGGLVGAPARD